MSTKARKVLNKLEAILNAEIPGTPRLGGRVTYVAIPGRGANRKRLTRRAAQVLAYVEKRRKATAADIMRAVRINRNALAGATHRLRSLGLLRSQRLT